VIPKTVRKIKLVLFYGKPVRLILKRVEYIVPLAGETYKFPLGG
jgi:hypothetical protein